MAEELKFKQELTGCFGKPVAENPTQAMIEPAYRAMGLDWRYETLAPGMVVADVIPNPPRTRLVRDAEGKGCRVIDGLGMLVAQGVIGIEYWTGRTPDAAVMRSSLEVILRSK